MNGPPSPAVHGMRTGNRARGDGQWWDQSGGAAQHPRDHALLQKVTQERDEAQRQAQESDMRVAELRSQVDELTVRWVLSLLYRT